VDQPGSDQRPRHPLPGCCWSAAARSASKWASFYAGMGAQVTIVQRAARLVDREDPRVGELAAKALAALGVTVRTGVTPVSARHRRRDDSGDAG